MLILITGHPAAGKTTLAKQLAFALCQQNKHVHVFDEFQKININENRSFDALDPMRKQEWHDFICHDSFKAQSKICIIQDASNLPSWFLARVDLHIDCKVQKRRRFRKDLHRFQVSHGFAATAEGVQDGKVKYKSYPFAGVVNV